MLAAAIMLFSAVSAYAADTDFVISDDKKLEDGEEIGDEEDDDDDSKSDKNNSSSNTNRDTSTDTEKEADTNPFNDVDVNMWCYDYVMDVYKKGLILGTADDTFSPNTSLTRAMVASIVYRMAGSPDVSYSAIFTDVPEGQWYTAGIIWAYNNGVISGYGNGLCGPNDYVTVEQLASILYRYAGSPEVADSVAITGYSDYTTISDYAQKAMLWAVSKNMNQGDNLHPASAATRAEAAKMFSLF